MSGSGALAAPQDDHAAAHDVVDDDDRAGTRELQRRREIDVVARPVRVDEDEVERLGARVDEDLSRRGRVWSLMVRR